ncbi:aspartyl protease family protein [Salinimicrobium oceani]|uniref:PDZ domain-containing protein n=1 Tax=Salinimicrobium oceani TaxID=2722702 RepID=A0ABX1CZ02_9FLAO|nr:aspartyl protease family protein [Salinimicrobium oceani]NJW51856.1 PDZ domain-containing protein [Salinimicrobium oceani]
MLKCKLLILLLFGGLSICLSQENFVIKNGRSSAKVKFDLVNNLIIVPVSLNGVELNFLVDTGVKTTVLLNLNEQDSMELNSAEKIHLRGLGGEELIEAFRSQDNEIRLGNLKHTALTVYVIYDEKINFSPRLGLPVHGIIGYDLFKDFIVEINYPKNFLRLHDRKKFQKNLRKYERLPLEFFQEKPYLTVSVNIEGEESQATLLLDNGLSDALWLFTDNEEIKVPQHSFPDFLGLGLLGDVVGLRSRISSLQIGSQIIPGVTTSFPDNLSVEGLQTYHARKGSIGSEIFKRFHMIFDYNEEVVYLRKNKWFDDAFNYDMSGIVLEHSGFVMVETYEKSLNAVSAGSEEDNLLVIEPSFYKKFELRPAFRIASLREGSPALLAGLLEGDEIVKVNRKNAYKLGIEDFISLFTSEEGKTISLKVLRAGRNLNFSFKLKDPLK